MIEYQELKPTISKLRPFIDSYMHLTWDEKGMKSKDMLPRLGVSMIFADKKIWINNKTLSKNILVGIHDEVFNFRWVADRTFCFIINFSPYGLSRFLKINMQQIANKLIESEAIWGNSINILHEKVMRVGEVNQQIELVEKFLSERIIIPTKTEESIFQVADILRNEDEIPSLAKIRKDVPISARQLERKFKKCTGVNIQTYIRICRFEHAKSLLTKQRDLKLTEIGYASGYFDQAHFSNEFKILSTFRPKDFIRSSPFYQFLSDMERRNKPLLSE